MKWGVGSPWDASMWCSKSSPGLRVYRTARILTWRLDFKKVMWMDGFAWAFTVATSLSLGEIPCLYN